MKGHVPTPDHIVDRMVEKLFSARPPVSHDLLLDPGCADGPFIAGILRYCDARKIPAPRIVGIELDDRHLVRARERFTPRNAPTVTILPPTDYLAAGLGPADFIIGNPPYVSILGLDEDEKKRYRARFRTAVGRFDLYLLFFEQSLENLKPNGRLVFITPEKYEYVHTAEPLRRDLTTIATVEEIEHVDEETFADLTTYPTITTLVKAPPPTAHETAVRFRDGTERRVRLPRDGRSWAGAFQGLDSTQEHEGLTLADVCIRISAGIATGTDSVFVIPRAKVWKGIERFAHPTISGRQLALPQFTSNHNVVDTKDVMLVPYDEDGDLLAEGELGELGEYLRFPHNLEKLKARVHVANRGRAYYRFHDNMPMTEVRRPKLLCKDITPEPKFWADRHGDIIPRHTVYYAVPAENVDFDALLTYLNSDEAASWLKAHAQRAANGFYRLQSKVLQQLPVPDHVVLDYSEDPSGEKARGKSRPRVRGVQTRLSSR